MPPSQVDAKRQDVLDEDDHDGHKADQQVLLSGRPVSLASVRANPERFTRLFATTKATVGFAECGCTVPPQKLVIRSRDGRYHLACWPGGRAQHVAQCHFHRAPDTLSGLSSYTTAVQEDFASVAVTDLAPCWRTRRRGPAHDGLARTAASPVGARGTQPLARPPRATPLGRVRHAADRQRLSDRGRPRAAGPPAARDPAL